MLDDQVKSDSYKRKGAKKAKKGKKRKNRFVKVFVGGGDLTEIDCTLLMPGSKKLGMIECPDSVGLPHEARVVALGRHRWMNMDIRIVVVQLNEIVNAPNGIRLRLHRNEPMTSVYDRVSNITGITLSALRKAAR